ncbi:hypothetical protein G3G77_004946 [Salmonella enterica]|nr:hypothetical protein [Salmonella enterica]EEH5466672.1 hypothetical protein [Salmonella enterica]EEH7556180.1 hypothetical protein [Salmonella enterica]EEO5640203.1 hypothetical protein [Salmonella enterica]EEQ0204175.1 hypothetical protein [Salmonella enterica]
MTAPVPVREVARHQQKQTGNISNRNNRRVDTMRIEKRQQNMSMAKKECRSGEATAALVCLLTFSQQPDRKASPKSGWLSEKRGCF